ncbi:hypothetical protein [Ramlibacter sp. PS4R-6]|uniref:hypothetical protein n=1 Tax=Ramlibacter sp. PS4R-6 TaxID=3133438 RepID=UPI00309C2D5B
MTSTRSIRTEAGAYADDARTLASQALDSTREYANEAFDRAGARLRDLRTGVKDIASRGAGSVNEYTRATTRYIADEPVKSALIAAAVGAAVAGIVIAMRRYNSTNRY